MMILSDRSTKFGFIFLLPPPSVMFPNVIVNPAPKSRCLAQLETGLCVRCGNSVLIEPPIQEEDDSSSAAQLDESAKRSNLPAPPVQYDPKTSTTTLTKKVFAGYQQVITTKSPEGKTHTQTKTVYDPSVDLDVVDAPTKVASSAPIVQTEQKATPPPATSTPSAAEEVPTTKSTPPRVSASPRPQMPSPPPPQQQQVAQESMAGKNPAPGEPVKSLRRKRLSSPQATPPTASTPPVTHALSSPSLPTAPKTVPTKTATAAASKPTTTTNTTTTASPSVATHHHSLPPALARTRSAEPVTTTTTANNAGSTATATPPPVPPRRKRESKVTRIGKAHQ